MEIDTQINNLQKSTNNIAQNYSGAQINNLNNYINDKEDFYITVIIESDDLGFLNKTEIIDNIYLSILHNDKNVKIIIDLNEDGNSEEAQLAYLELFFGTMFQSEIKSNIYNFINTLKNSNVNISKIQNFVNDLAICYISSNDIKNRKLSTAVNQFIYNNTFAKNNP